MGPDRLTPSYSPEPCLDGIGLDDLMSPPPEYDMWGTLLAVPAQERTRAHTPLFAHYSPAAPSSAPYSPATPSSYGPPPSVTNFHLLGMATSFENHFRRLANEAQRVHYDAR